MSSYRRPWERPRLVHSEDNLYGDTTNFDLGPVHDDRTLYRQPTTFAYDNDHSHRFVDNNMTPNTFNASGLPGITDLNPLQPSDSDMLNFNILTFKESSTLIKRWKPVPTEADGWPTAEGFKILVARQQIVKTKMVNCDPSRIRWEKENLTYLYYLQNGIFNQENLYDNERHHEYVDSINTRHEQDAFRFDSAPQFDDGYQGLSAAIPTSNIQTEAGHTTATPTTKKRGRPINLTGDPEVDARRKKGRESQQSTREKQKKRIAEGLPAKTRGPLAGKMVQPKRPTTQPAIPVASVNRSFVDPTIDASNNLLWPGPTSTLATTQQASNSTAMDLPLVDFQPDYPAFDMDSYLSDDLADDPFEDSGYQFPI